MNRIPSTLLVAVAVVTAHTPTPAAAQYLGGGTKTAAEAQVSDLEEMRDKFVSLGEAFPEEAWDWRPMEGVRSVRDVLALIGAETTLFPTMWGFEAPAWVPEPGIGPELQRLRDLPPDESLAEVERGFDHVIELVRGLDGEARAEMVNFFGLEVPLGTAVTLMANDMHEHLGQLIAYARTNRIVPPWSRPDGG